MAIALLRPGQTHGDVPKMKHALVRELLELGHRDLASEIDPDGKTYGPAAVRAVTRFQADRGLDADGIVGKNTWTALGVIDDVVDARPILNGVPWEDGVIAIDGIWVAEPLAREILAARRRGAWRGRMSSGYRPDWYQATLFTAAVKKYGSEAAARKWVAPPGRSRHRFKDGRGAADATDGAALDAASQAIVRPMSWEPWHVQLAAADDEAAPAVEDRDVEGAALEPPIRELEQQGVAVRDVEATADELLARFDDLKKG